MKKRIEVPVGKTIHYRGKELKAVYGEDVPCTSYHFSTVTEELGGHKYECISLWRSDKKLVHFQNRPDIADRLKGKRK